MAKQYWEPKLIGGIVEPKDTGGFQVYADYEVQTTDGPRRYRHNVAISGENLNGLFLLDPLDPAITLVEADGYVLFTG